MNKFAATAVLAVAASAIELEQTIDAAGQVGNVDYVVFGDSKSYDATFDMLPDEKMVAAMRQGEGRDHTDWSWHMEHLEEAEKVRKAREDVNTSHDGRAGAIREYDELMAVIIEADEEHSRQCQLHREEEMNLYYQCTQNDINNYALHHFGGNVRSYPRWVQEYNVCIDHIHRAKTLHLDFFLADGETQKRPCDPQSHDSTTYIGYTAPVLVVEIPEIIIEPVEPEPEIEIIVIPEPVDPIVTIQPVDPIVTIQPVDPIVTIQPVDPVVPVVVVVDTEVMTLTPLNPAASCDTQAFPDYSGIWIPLKTGDDAGKMLDGSQAIDHSSYTPQCFSFKGTGHQKADISMSWKTQKNTYNVSLVRDDRTTENGCGIKEAMEGSSYAGWVGPVDATTSMSDQHLYGAMTKNADGVEVQSPWAQSVKWIRLGTCQLGEGTTIHKQYSTSVKIIGGYEW